MATGGEGMKGLGGYEDTFGMRERHNFVSRERNGLDCTIVMYNRNM